ncbi:MAG: hypothetical protein Q7R92_03440 [bacterium]|nr:hypothetical protein [bacterium]
MDRKEIEDCSIPDYIWQLCSNIVELLLNEMLHGRDQKAIRYYANEFSRVGEVFFSPQQELKTPTELMDAAETEETISVVDDSTWIFSTAVPEPMLELEKKTKKSRGKVKLNHLSKVKVLTGRERQIINLVMLNGQAPADMASLVNVMSPNITKRQLGVAIGRCSRALRGGFKKLKVILRDGSAHETDRELVQKIEAEFPAFAQNFENLAKKMFEKYGVKMPADWGEPLIVSVAILPTATAPVQPLGIQPEPPILIPPEKQSGNNGHKLPFPKEEWAQLIHIALLVGDPSLDSDTVATKTKLSPDMVPAMLQGALNILRQNWVTPENEETAAFVSAVKQRVPKEIMDKIMG